MNQCWNRQVELQGVGIQRAVGQSSVIDRSKHGPLVKHVSNETHMAYSFPLPGGLSINYPAHDVQPSWF
ncbi:MAG: hypothetical protein OXD44_04160 [Gammaproteobacteria bacterium]|nr:hypothetical protein [Gammaproteobacteria bacterium]